MYKDAVDRVTQRMNVLLEYAKEYSAIPEEEVILCINAFLFLHSPHTLSMIQRIHTDVHNRISQHEALTGEDLTLIHFIDEYYAEVSKLR